MYLCDRILGAAADIESRVRLGPKWKPNWRDPETWVLNGVYPPYFAWVADKLRQAVRYVLDEPVAESAVHVALSRPSSLADALGIVRVPNAVCWLEWAERPRIEFLRTQTELRETQKETPERVGILFVTDEEGRRGEAHFMWYHGVYDGIEFPNLCPVVARFDFDGGFPPIDLREPRVIPVRWKRHVSDPKELASIFALSMIAIDDPLDQHFGGVADGVTAAWLRTIEEQLGEKPMRRIIAGWRGDIEMELMFGISVLILLMARNGVEREPVERPAKLNTARAKKGKQPLLDHIIVRMRLTKTERSRIAAAGGAGGAAARNVRLHLVKGHYVVRRRPKEVIYWRRGHTRGGHGGAGETPPTKTVLVTA